MALKITINGRERTLEQVTESCSLSELLATLELRQDHVAVELNGSVCSRLVWSNTVIHNNDRLEVVHFVGGG